MKRKVVILSGLVKSGKSAALLEWVHGKAIEGFITPTVDGSKVFFDIASGKYYPYELQHPKESSIAVGRFILDGATFTMARKLMNETLRSTSKWLVVDEIGLLELDNMGHHLLFEELLLQSKLNILVVVRSSLVDAVIAKYKLFDTIVIDINRLNELL